MRLQRGVWLVTLLPMTLNLGAPVALLATAAALVIAWTTQWIFTHAEQAELRQTIGDILAKRKSGDRGARDQSRTNSAADIPAPASAATEAVLKTEPARDRPTIGILYPGDMGANLGSLLIRHGFTVVTALEGRTPTTARLSEQTGIRDVSNLAAVAAEADIVISLVAPTAALTTAEKFCRGLRSTSRTRLFIDLNSISAMTASEIEQVCSAHGIPMVDGAIHGQASRLADHAMLYLSGNDAERVATLFRGLLPTRVVGDEVGRASMLKILMGGVSKGITVLFLEMGRAASEAQMLYEFWQSIVRFYPGFTSAVERMLPTVPRHATRRAGEMGELADTLASLELRPGLALEFQRVFAEVARAALPASVSPHDLSVPELLERLARAMCDGSRDFNAELHQHSISTISGN
jgi:3-hydroxyisobutyrate dehydrogenase-like beta-hydroxyacid dehydrogenase